MPDAMPSLDEALSRIPLIAILRGVRPGEVVGIAERLVAAGLTIIEVPEIWPTAGRNASPGSASAAHSTPGKNPEQIEADAPALVAAMRSVLDRAQDDRRTSIGQRPGGSIRDDGP